ncbi:MAG TPA: hypothetical protein VM689_05850 [Aliidongia sp.]|nr:hypothetical protein [Aliidongia sp.]
MTALLLGGCSPSSNAPGAKIRDVAIDGWCGAVDGVDGDKDAAWLHCAPPARPASEIDSGRFDAALGKMYAQGNGVPKDDARALRLYEAGAKLDNPDALNALGECYAEERGVPRDDAKAAALFKRAAALGNPDAQQNLDRMTAQGRYAPDDKKKDATPSKA